MSQCCINEYAMEFSEIHFQMLIVKYYVVNDSKDVMGQLHGFCNVNVS